MLERALDVDLGLRIHVGTEDILLALASVNEGEAISVLRSLGVEPDQIRDAVIELSGSGVRRLRPRSRARGYGRRVASAASVSEGPALESGFRVAPGGDVLRVLMSTAARALEGGRTEMTMRDLLLALARDEQAGLVFGDLGLEETAILMRYARRLSRMRHALPQADNRTPSADRPGPRGRWEITRTWRLSQNPVGCGEACESDRSGEAACCRS